MMFLPVLLIGLLVQLLIGSLIAAVILRAACALFNKFFGKGQPVSNDQPGFPPGSIGQKKTADPQSLESQSPYAPPMAPLMQSGSLATRGVPEPKFGKAFMICLVASIANMMVGFLLGLVFGMFFGGAGPNAAQEFAVAGMLAIQICSLIAGLFILASAIKLGLPTSIPRALGVTGLFMMIGVAVGVAIAIVVGLIMTLGGFTV